ncbi:carboxypeptidase-like regulatory domain-containing protein [Bacteroides ovatus]|nr:carboxypeptidase-like regulatory domain-containing protein [Bacteroides ovatus]
MKGTVTDGIGEPLPGVSVVVKGTTHGTITDVNGKYSIHSSNAKATTFYHSSYVGMSDQEIKVAGQTTINVVMKDDVAALDEVIVVGYGTAKKQSLTGYVSAVKGDELLKATGNQCVESSLGDVCQDLLSVQVSGEPGTIRLYTSSWPHL